MNADRLILIVEDRGHERFLREALAKRGFSRHKLAFQVKPAGGAGDQWVVDYLSNKSAILKRRLANQPRLGIVVAIDGDTSGLGKRKKQVENAFGYSDDMKLQIATLVPCRNIETWIWYLLGNSANENLDYKTNVKNLNDHINWRSVVIAFWSATPDDALPAHLDAISEFEKL